MRPLSVPSCWGVLNTLQLKHILMPPSPRDFTDIYAVFELMEADLHLVRSRQGTGSQVQPSHRCVNSGAAEKKGASFQLLGWDVRRAEQIFPVAV